MLRAGRGGRRCAWPRCDAGSLVLVLAVGGRRLRRLQLETNAGTETLVDEDSREFRATERFREDFGDDAAVVLVREDLRQLVLTKDLQALFELETCLAGGTEFAPTLPRRDKQPLPEVCDRIAELAPSRVVFGPATFLFQSVTQIQQVLQGQIGSAPAGGPGRPAQQAASRPPRGGRLRGGAAAGRPRPPASRCWSSFQSEPDPARASQFDITRPAAPRRPRVRQQGGLRPQPSRSAPRRSASPTSSPTARRP